MSISWVLVVSISRVREKISRARARVRITQLLPRQLFERFELEEQIGIRDDMNFHRQTLKKQGTVISGFVDRSSTIHGPQAGAASRVRLVLQLWSIGPKISTES
jgi:hypothetical protein